MVKLQYDEKNDRVHMTIPQSKGKALGWRERLQNGEDIDVDVSTLPDRDGVSAREI